MQSKKSSLATLTNAALCKLRDEIAELLESRAEALRRELHQLIGGGGLIADGGDTNGGEEREERQLERLPQNIEDLTAKRGPGEG